MSRINKMNYPFLQGIASLFDFRGNFVRTPELKRFETHRAKALGKESQKSDPHQECALAIEKAWKTVGQALSKSMATFGGDVNEQER